MKISWTASRKLTLIPDASMATTVTRARPIISAAAVDAVRCGLRRALSRASRPGLPPSSTPGQPITAASGRTRRDEKSATPMNTNTTPSPMDARIPVVLRPFLKRPNARSAKPTAIVAIAPTVRKRAKRPSGSVAPSRTAAIGGTRVERIAGRRLARTVTRMPTRSDTMIVRVSSGRPARGSVIPNASNSDESPCANATPSPSPTSEAKMPSSSDSKSTDRSTCLRVAPSVRSVASSRVRCAIVIESEFAITKAPTKSAIPPKASRKSWRKLRLALVSLVSFWAWPWPVRTCSLSGSRTGSIWSTSSCGETPGLPWTRIWSSWPTLSKIRWAVPTSKPDSVAPPMFVEPPKRKIPARRIFCAGPSAWTPIVSPTFQCSSPAVRLSTTTSFGPGQVPLANVIELSSGAFLSTLKPMFGAPPWEIALPFLPIRCADPATPPIASLTPGSCLTLGSSVSGNGGAFCELLEIADLPLMTASVFL